PIRELKENGNLLNRRLQHLERALNLGSILFCRGFDSARVFRFIGGSLERPRNLDVNRVDEMENLENENRIQFTYC
ncbi:hypothetical protein ALC60_06402, partial [Trachymyrmex zeteki]